MQKKTKKTRHLCYNDAPPPSHPIPSQHSSALPSPSSPHTHPPHHTPSESLVCARSVHSRWREQKGQDGQERSRTCSFSFTTSPLKSDRSVPRGIAQGRFFSFLLPPAQAVRSAHRTALQTGELCTQMHVTACLAGQKVDVEVGEDCRTLQALKEAIVEALPQLCVEGFDVSVGGRALDDDESVVSLEHDVCLDVVPNTRGLSVLALREAGHEVSEDGLLAAADECDMALCTLYLDAGVPIDCTDQHDNTPLHISCWDGQLSLATMLLDRGSDAIDEKDDEGNTPLHRSCHFPGHLSLATLLLDRGSTAIDEKDDEGNIPLHHACRAGRLSIAKYLLDRGSTAIDVSNTMNYTPLLLSCGRGHVEIARLLLDRGCAIDEKDGLGYAPLHLACLHERLETARLLLDRGFPFDVTKYRTRGPYSQEVLRLLSERGHDVPHDPKAKRRRLGGVVEMTLDPEY